MARFATSLRSAKLRPAGGWGRAVWVLLDPLVFESDILRATITVPIGFETDYASVPRLPGAYWLTGDGAHESAVVHDWMLTCGHSWRTAADVFREAMKAEGVPTWRAWLMYWGVRVAEPSNNEGAMP